MPATITSKIKRSSNEVQIDLLKKVIGMLARASDGLIVGFGDGDGLGDAAGDATTAGEAEAAGEVAADGAGEAAGDAAADVAPLRAAGVGEMEGDGEGVGRHSQYPRFFASTSSSLSSASLGHGVGGQILKSMTARTSAKIT
jgi:hypothetical protein